MKKRRQITPKSTKVAILGAIFGAIWSSISRGGGSFWRPGPRNLLGGYPLERFWPPRATPGEIFDNFWMDSGVILLKMSMILGSIFRQT